jgi:hypothetical protein
MRLLSPISRLLLALLGVVLIPSALADDGGALAPQCKADTDCVFDDVDCSVCGQCPGFPPYAESRKERDARARECQLHPPLRLQPWPRVDGGLPPPAMPQCSPCPTPPDRPLPTRAACEKGRCVAR